MGENIRLSHVFLINKGRLRDLPFDVEAHNCQNSRQEKWVLFSPLEQPPPRIHEYRSVWVGIFMRDKCVLGAWASMSAFFMHFRIKMDISQCYNTHAHVIFSDLPPVFVDFQMITISNRDPWGYLWWILIHTTDLGLCLCQNSECRNALFLLWPFTFSIVQTPSAANVTSKAARPGFVPDVILSLLPMATPQQHHHRPNKARQMISICPLQSREEVIDTIRQMMSRICQQSLWMTKTAHLLPPLSLPLPT